MPEERVGYMYYMEQMKLTEDPSKTAFNEIQSLTFDNISNYHKQNVAGKIYAMCVVASKDRIKDTDLSKYGKVIKLNLQDIFGY